MNSATIVSGASHERDDQDARQRRNITRTAIILGLVAVATYLGFMLAIAIR